MGSIRITEFGGLKPSEKRGYGDPSRASIARDSKLNRGALEAWRYPSKEIETDLDRVCTIYNDDCCFVVSDKACANFAKGDTNCKRVFSTGHMDWPAYANLPDDCTGPCGQVPELTWCRLGVPKPPNAPSISGVTVSAAVAEPYINEGDKDKLESRSYIYTFVNEWGEEGPPSPPSNIVDADFDSSATLGISIPPLDEGFCNPDKIRIYRGASGWNQEGAVGSTTANYFFVEEIPFRTGNFQHVDDIAPDELSEVNASDCYYPPMASLENLVVTDSGVLVASEGKNVWFSEPWKFHAWSCHLNLDDCVKALAVRGEYIYAITNGYPYVISTENNEEDCKCCRSVNKIPTSAPIACKRSLVTTINGVVWASTVGLVRITGSGEIGVDTHSHMTEDEWQKWMPHDIKAVYFKGAYYGFNSERGFIWDINDGMYTDAYLGDSGKFTELSFTPTAVWVTKNNTFYMAFDGALHRWDGGDVKMPYTWRSKLNIEGGLQNFSAMKIVFERWLRGSVTPTPVHVSLYADDVLRFQRNVNTSKPFRLPKGYDALNWEIEVTGTESLIEIHMATSMQELTLLNNV